MPHYDVMLRSGQTITGTIDRVSALKKLNGKKGIASVTDSEGTFRVDRKQIVAVCVWEGEKNKPVGFK